MFKIGDYVIYGMNGVCIMNDIGPLDFQESKNERLYYTLTPINAKGRKLFTPVDNDKVIIRPLISRKEAKELVDDFANTEISWHHDPRKREENYKLALKSCDCRKLIKIIKILYFSKESRLAEGKKVIASDEKYIQLVEDSLYGELAIALGINREEVEGYILKRGELLNL